VQKQSKKNKGTHIQEIQAFQKFFQTVYDPLHLKRTGQYAAKTLRDKINDKLPVNIFLPYILKLNFHHYQLVISQWLLGHHIQNGCHVIPY